MGKPESRRPSNPYAVSPEDVATMHRRTVHQGINATFRDHEQRLTALEEKIKELMQHIDFEKVQFNDS